MFYPKGALFNNADEVEAKTIRAFQKQKIRKISVHTTGISPYYMSHLVDNFEY